MQNFLAVFPPIVFPRRRDKGPAAETNKNVRRGTGILLRTFYRFIRLYYLALCPVFLSVLSLLE